MICSYGTHLIAIFLIVAGSVLSVVTQKLTLTAAFAGASIAFLIYFSAGFTGLFMLATFFLTATAATGLKKRQKQSILPFAHHQVKRAATQVFANAAAPAALAVLIFTLPEYTDLLLLMMAGSLASATSDTLSSELGLIYGRRFYNIISFKKESPGLDGVISLEGTLAGLAGAIFIAFIYGFGYRQFHWIWIVGCGGMAGNVIDSLLGSAFERTGLLNNDMVNFFNTVSAGLVCFLLYFVCA